MALDLEINLNNFGFEFAIMDFKINFDLLAGIWNHFFFKSGLSFEFLSEISPSQLEVEQKGLYV